MGKMPKFLFCAVKFSNSLYSATEFVLLYYVWRLMYLPRNDAQKSGSRFVQNQHTHNMQYAMVQKSDFAMCEKNDLFVNKVCKTLTKTIDLCYII